MLIVIEENSVHGSLTPGISVKLPRVKVKNEYSSGTVLQGSSFYISTVSISRMKIYMLSLKKLMQEILCSNDTMVNG